MRKLHIVLTVIFAIGVLLGGIGIGTAIVEYSELEYNGKIYIGQENLVTKDFDYEFTPSIDEQIMIDYCYWGDYTKDTLIVQDEDIPIGLIKYRVTYNDKLVSPNLINWTIDDTELPEPQTVLDLRCYNFGNYFDIFMQNKDKIIEDLKQKKVTSYEIVEIKDVEILVNPQSMPYIKDCTR